MIRRLSATRRHRAMASEPELRREIADRAARADERRRRLARGARPRRPNAESRSVSRSASSPAPRSRSGRRSGSAATSGITTPAARRRNARERVDDRARMRRDVLVRQRALGRPNATRKASDRLPSPICSPRYSSNTATSRSSRAASRIAARSSPPGRPRRRRRRDPGAPPGKGSPPRTRGLGRALGERVEVELERTPDALEQRGVQLADPALGRPRGLAGWRNARASARTPAEPSAR